MRLIDKKNTEFLLWIIFFPGIFSWLPEIIYFSLWGILVLFIIFFNKLNKKNLRCSLILTVIFIINFIIFPYKKITIFLYINFLLKCYPLYFVCSKAINKEYFIYFGYKLGIISNVCIILEKVILGKASYMGLGYHLLPVILIYIFFYLKHKKGFTLLLILINSFYLIIYGNRGASLSLIIFTILLYFIFYKKTLNKIIHLISITNFILIFFIFKDKIKNILINFSSFLLKDLKINSYFLSKLILLLNKGLASSSSGRDTIYTNAIKFGNENWLFGNGIGSFRYIYGAYPHNIFLEFYVQFGIFGVIVLIYLLIKVFSYLLLKNYKNKEILLFLFCLSIPRLILSSSFWERPEFWGLIAFLGTNKIFLRGRNGKKFIVKKCYI